MKGQLVKKLNNKLAQEHSVFPRNIKKTTNLNKNTEVSHHHHKFGCEQSLNAKLFLLFLFTWFLFFNWHAKTNDKKEKGENGWRISTINLPYGLIKTKGSTSQLRNLKINKKKDLKKLARSLAFLFASTITIPKNKLPSLHIFLVVYILKDISPLYLSSANWRSFSVAKKKSTDELPNFCQTFGCQKQKGIQSLYVCVSI